LALIKHEQANTLLRNAVVLDLGDVSRQAEQIRASAEAKAKEMIEHAEAEVERIASQAHDEASERGYIEGKQRGLEEGREEGRQKAFEEVSGQLKELHRGWQGMMNQWEADAESLHAEGREAVLRFALRLAERVVYRTIEVDPTVIVDQVAAGLSCVLRPMDVTVRIHPDDRPVLEGAMTSIIEDLPNLKHVRLVDDDSIARGGCDVSYGSGGIDATVETQLQRIAECMLPDDTEPAPEVATIEPPLPNEPGPGSPAEDDVTPPNAPPEPESDSTDPDPEA